MFNFIVDFSAVVILSILPDYISLWKGRKVLDALASWNNTFSTIGLILFDIVASALLSYVLIVTTFCAYVTWFMWTNTPAYSYQPVLGHLWYGGSVIFLNTLKTTIAVLFGLKTEDSVSTDLFIGFFFFSTLFTSSRAILVGLSSALVKLVTPIKVFAKATRWLFDVQKRPVQSIGVGAAAITFGVSLIVHAL